MVWSANYSRCWSGVVGGDFSQTAYLSVFVPCYIALLMNSFLLPSLWSLLYLLCFVEVGINWPCKLLLNNDTCKVAVHNLCTMYCTLYCGVLGSALWLYYLYQLFHFASVGFRKNRTPVTITKLSWWHFAEDNVGSWVHWSQAGTG